jgi:hypothetical protein
MIDNRINIFIFFIKLFFKDNLFFLLEETRISGEDGLFFLLVLVFGKRGNYLMGKVKLLGRFWFAMEVALLGLLFD